MLNFAVEQLFSHINAYGSQENRQRHITVILVCASDYDEADKEQQHHSHSRCGKFCHRVNQEQTIQPGELYAA